MQRPPIYAFSGIFGPNLTCRAVAFCMDIAICHKRKFGQVCGSSAPLPEIAGNLRPLDLRLSHGKIGITLRCNRWAVGWSPEGTFYGFCMGKIGQNPKIGQVWRPVAPQPYVVEKSWQKLGNSLALELQCGVNTIYLQCIPWPVACWVRCLFERFSISDFGANDP